MIDGQQIRIRLLRGAPKAWLCLEGTILTYCEKSWGRETTVDIPLELVTIVEKRQLKASRLIAALFSLLCGPCMTAAMVGIWYLINRSVSETALSFCLAIGALCGFILFVALLIRFFIRQTTISILVGPGPLAISFWMESGQRQALKDLVEEITDRRTLVEDTIPYPMRFALGDTVVQPWKRTVILTFLCSIPALITEIRWLLFACAIPVGFYAYSSLQALLQPSLYRRAVRRFLNKQWDQAGAVVKELVSKAPDFLPARLLHIEILMRLDDFAGATAVLADIQSNLNAETLQAIQQDIIYRTRMSKRKKTGPC